MEFFSAGMSPPPDMPANGDTVALLFRGPAFFCEELGWATNLMKRDCIDCLTLLIAQRCR